MRRKGVPCACDPCKGKNYVRAVNNVSPDPNGDLIIRGGQGIEIIQSGDDLVINNTANPNAFIAGRNIELNPSGDDIAIEVADEPEFDGLTVNGDLEVNGDIIQNGSAYETHAEHVFAKDDYIIMRDGAIAGLPQGDYSGFQVKLYDGVDDGRLVIDREGTARVGDVGDEQPLLTRDESSDLTDGHLLEWDAANSKAIDSGTDVSTINTAINGKVSGTGNIGSDTKPIKIVNGQAVAVTNDLALNSAVVHIAGAERITGTKTFDNKVNIKGAGLSQSSLSVSFGFADIQFVDDLDRTVGLLRFLQQGNGISLHFIGFNTAGSEAYYNTLVTFTRT